MAKIKLVKKEIIEIKLQKQIIDVNDEERFVIYDYFSKDEKIIENSMIHNASGELITSEDTGGIFIADIYNFLDELGEEEPKQEEPKQEEPKQEEPKQEK